MIQMRNLNMDPDRLFQGRQPEEEGMGIVTMLALLEDLLPDVEIASYSRALGE